MGNSTTSSPASTLDSLVALPFRFVLAFSDGLKPLIGVPDQHIGADIADGIADVTLR